jgi:hypothetical protein
MNLKAVTGFITLRDIRRQTIFVKKIGDLHTDKKEYKIFIIYKEIRDGAVAPKSYMTNGLLIYGEIFAHCLIY